VREAISQCGAVVLSVDMRALQDFLRRSFLPCSA
jgi:hypothetical protein